MTSSVRDRRLTVELAALVLERVAPDELSVLDEMAEEYFDDPDRALRSGRSDQPLGAGITVAMMTPYLLAVAGAVLPVLGSIIGGALQGAATDELSAHIRALFRRSPDEPPGPVALTAHQAHAVHEAVAAQCRAVGMGEDTAILLARATVGSLHLRRP
jgi:hypothetical protein